MRTLPGIGQRPHFIFDNCQEFRKSSQFASDRNSHTEKHAMLVLHSTLNIL